jgi:tetratricopeptide (TPR) repeat protein
MPTPNKRSSNKTSEPRQGSFIAMLAERPQLDFELAFFGQILESLPDFTDVLLAHSANLTAKGLLKEGLLVDKKLSELRPDDPDIFYQMACRYAALKQPDLALQTLRRAIELGFRDFRALINDREFALMRKDPRFKELLLEYGEL